MKGIMFTVEDRPSLVVDLRPTDAYGNDMSMRASLILEEFEYHDKKLYRVHKNRFGDEGLPLCIGAKHNKLLTQEEVDYLIDRVRGRGFVLYV